MISMIALFVALGGGYALAFVGSGQLQKGGKLGLTGSLQTIRSLDGIGSIQASCNEGTNDITVRFNNTSGNDLRVDQVDYGNEDGTPLFSNTTHNGGFNETTVTLLDVLRWYVHPRDGSKRPQAEIMIGTEEDNTGDPGSNCTRAEAYVLVLNTEE